MIDRKTLLDDLKKLLPKLEADLLERSESADVPDVGAKLREEYAEAQAASRTAQSFTEWRSDAITQHAAAWVLSSVFVRFLEDNGLVDTPVIAGPGDRLKRARDEHEVYFRSHPTQTDRDYLLAVFDGFTKPAATRDVFGEHNPIRDLPNWLSGDAARNLLEFFQRIDPNTGLLVHDFTDPTWDTRFLGDLYQDLSEVARKKYALCQTPEFVQEFILDRILDPAVEEFGLAKPGYEKRLETDGRLYPDDRFGIIDPACGSGHFLLGSFARLLERWRKKDPNATAVILVQRALDSVHGVDINPYAIAIARFRLLIAALNESDVSRLSNSQLFTIHLVCGDSLLHESPRGDQATMGWAPTDHVYQPEDRNLLTRVLRPKSYHAVVANPPYITPKDRALNLAYRERYSTCHMKYSLAVPFLERVVSLAVDGGFMGLITANSFMKREFGKKLIEFYFPRLDLTHIIDTSGAYIPGHGTPTVILFARNQQPIASTLRTVMGIRGEPATPDDPSKGLVWSAIVDQIDQPGSQSEFVSVGDSPRELFHKHPWSIGGGGAAELKERLEEVAVLRLEALVDCIGFGTILGEDEAFGAPVGTNRIRQLPPQLRRPIIEGDKVRDWNLDWETEVLFPYTAEIELRDDQLIKDWFWPLRSLMLARADFSKRTYAQCGRPYWEYHQIPVDRNRIPLSIVFGEVATHNHFVIDRGGKVFNRTAPVIKLPTGATEDDHLALLGLLNSSTACFWLKQVCFDKGNGGIGGGIGDEKWERRSQLAGTAVSQFPVPLSRPMSLSLRLDEIARQLGDLAAHRILECWPKGKNLAAVLEEAKATTAHLRGMMIALQEELDWHCYHLYGLLAEDGQPASNDLPELALGQRAFEIVMARRMAKGEFVTSWFNRHGSEPVTQLPSHWPEAYRDLVEQRIRVIESNREITLIEQPEYKRRWHEYLWDDLQAKALFGWLLDRLESYSDFDGRMNDAGKPTARLEMGLTTVGRLADVARQDPEFLQVGELYRNDAAFDVSRLVAELVEGESVPLLPVLRYKDSGLRKRAEWEATWAFQRQEDMLSNQQSALSDQLRTAKDEAEKKAIHSRIEGLTADGRKLTASIPVPPKYTSADFLKGDYWRLRGKLDVPKERWVSFPHCEGEDGTAMFAWAGYDHLQLARAISTFYVDVQERLGGRDDPRLVPLLAGLIELLPWLKQWHNEVDPEFGVPMGDYFEGFIAEEARSLEKTIDEIKAWTPPQKAGGRRRRSTS